MSNEWKEYRRELRRQSMKAWLKLVAWLTWGIIAAGICATAVLLIGQLAR